MKNIFEKWEQELEQKMPKLRQDILDEPIPQKKIKTVEFTKKKTIFKYLSLIGSIAAVIVLCICIIPLINNNPPPITTVGEESTILTVEINPRAVFISDKNGIVTRVVATNKDADVILSTEGFDGIVVGKTTKEALINYAELATKLGYINADATDNAIKITALDREKDLNAMTEAKSGLEAHFKAKGIYAVVVGSSATIEKICEINEIEKTDKIENVIKGFNDRPPLYSKNELDNLPSESMNEYYKSYVALGLKDDVEKVLDIGEAILNTWELYWSLYARFGDYWMIINREQGMEQLPPEYKEIAEQIGEVLVYAQSYGIAIESKADLEKYCRSFWDNGIALGNMEDLRKEINELKNIQSYSKYKNIMALLSFDTTEFDRLEVQSITKEDIEKAQAELIKDEGANRIESNKDEYEKQREEIDDKSYDSYLENIKNQYGSTDNFWNEKHQGEKK